MQDDIPPRNTWLRRLLGGEVPPPVWPVGAQVENDVPYGRRPAQRLDIYAPPAAADCPVLVLVHGGGWVTGDKANAPVVVNKVLHWLPRGWLVVSVNYRLLPWAGPLEQAADVARALAAVQSQVSRWGGDGRRVVLLGHSTGAHLAALVMADASLGAPFALRPLQAAVLLDTAALDVVQVMQGPHLPLHDRAFGADPAQWRQASPWHQLKAAMPPLLIVCSSKRADSVAQSQRFAERAVEVGGSARVACMPLAHAEINQQLGLPGELTDTVDTFLQSQGLP